MTITEKKNLDTHKTETTHAASGKARHTLHEDLEEVKKQKDFNAILDSHSLENVVEVKLTRFFDQLGGYYPENLYEMIIKKVEKPLIQQILLRTGGNQLQAAQILGINRNTLRKKIKLYGI